jgi:ABC-type phosphate/phosphonate transport system substrate-binding protein
MAMIATLPMYDFPELRLATDGWWAGIARHAGVELPLARVADYMSPWSRADLLFSQTCGYPFTHHFKGRLGLVGTAHYAARGCEGALYSSFVLAREQRPLHAFAGAVAAVNSPDSMSGMLALKAFFVEHASAGRFFSSAKLSGSHLNSLAMVKRGEADVCAIDAVCIAHLLRWRPDLVSGLVEIGQTPLVHGLPYVSNDVDLGRWQRAVTAALADASLAAVREALMIKGFSMTTAADYDAILALERSVEQRGGLTLF